MGSIESSWRELDVAVIGGGIGMSKRNPVLISSPNQLYLQEVYLSLLHSERLVTKSQSTNEQISLAKLVHQLVVLQTGQDGYTIGE